MVGVNYRIKLKNVINIIKKLDVKKSEKNKFIIMPFYNFKKNNSNESTLLGKIKYLYFCYICILIRQNNFISSEVNNNTPLKNEFSLFLKNEFINQKSSIFVQNLITHSEKYCSNIYQKNVNVSITYIRCKNKVNICYF